MLLLLQKKKLQKQKTHNLNSDICKRRHFMSPFFILQIFGNVAKNGWWH